MRIKLAVWLGLWGLTTAVPAQIDRMNYRQWAWLQQQHRRLLASTVNLPLEKRMAVANSLLDNSEQLPLLTVARAIAVARGVDADAGFYFRSGLQVFALPEACARGRDLDVTVWAPYSGMTGKLPPPKKFAFEIRVTNAKGEVVRTGKIKENDRIRDLREFRSTVKIPLAGLPDGDYLVRVDTILDGVRARQTDLELRAPFSVLADYGDRAGRFRLVEQNRELTKELAALDPLRRAILQGVSEYASRAWFGVPGVSPSHTVRDLLIAESVRKNIAEGVFPLASVGGFATIALPVKGAAPVKGGERASTDVVFATLRLPAGGLPEKGSDAWQALAKKPLLLLTPSIPVLDHVDRRPSFPHFTLPGYFAEALQLVELDRDQEFQLVVVESPGRMKNTRAALIALLERLSEVFPFDGDRLVLAGEGYGAPGVADLAQVYPERVRGLVLADSSGGLAAPQLRSLRSLPILAIVGHAPVARQSVERLRIAAAAAKKPALEILDDQARPWSLTLPMAAREIEAFARRVTK
jgi:pimeloyl-ACP methyl ester carboxylesterase